MKKNVKSVAPCLRISAASSRSGCWTAMVHSAILTGPPAARARLQYLPMAAPWHRVIDTHLLFCRLALIASNIYVMGVGLKPYEPVGSTSHRRNVRGGDFMVRPSTSVRSPIRGALGSKFTKQVLCQLTLCRRQRKLRDARHGLRHNPHCRYIWHWRRPNFLLQHVSCACTSPLWHHPFVLHAAPGVHAQWHLLEAALLTWRSHLQSLTHRTAAAWTSTT